MLSRRLFVLAIFSVVLPGCVNRYKITLTNGNAITTTSRPKLDKKTKTFHFRDAHGRKDSLPAIRVTEIEAL